ncbi:calcium-binding protein [Planktothrix agardhii]|uniref:calcium-binding protein n=1 Tax=Planktothrix agardhii TaxID=1160 RepID=UPI001F32BEA7|nr:calcium-binding protein [Planktothrix agardhii]MCF3576141.1 calcium-binding protein [Planktothrix agardhii 1812]
MSTSAKLYYVEIANGAIKDIAGNNYAGITGNSTWNFKTQGTSTINGTAGADNLIGTANPDIINGLAGNDTLNGNTGADTLVGGLGNDIYVVDNTGDVVTELASQGTDLIQSSVTYTLPANVEDLTLTGTTAINGTGNTVANIITGNTANNILNGSSGADQLKGGTGNDTYVVDNTGDVVTELASQGTDLIQSSVTYTLPANVEDLTLTGTTAINGTGNTLANIITGNTANNILNGSSGADQLKGGTGNDTYVVDNTGDVVTELASQGTDLIQSSVTYTLPANVEDLTLTGTTAINGTGNTLANTVTGNTANNILNGGTGNDNLIGGSGTDQLLGSDGNDSLSGDAGNDTLTGGLGADKFIYNTNAAFTTTAVGVDTITDFNISQTDQIVLDKTTFTSISSAAGTGFSVASEFAKVTSDALAATSAADIVYNTTTGGLFYNQNGTAAGLGTGAQFLTLTNKPALTATQFLIQA